MRRSVALLSFEQDTEDCLKGDTGIGSANGTVSYPVGHTKTMGKNTGYGNFDI